MLLLPLDLGHLQSLVVTPGSADGGIACHSPHHQGHGAGVQLQQSYEDFNRLKQVGLNFADDMIVKAMLKHYFIPRFSLHT